MIKRGKASSGNKPYKGTSNSPRVIPTALGDPLHPKGLAQYCECGNIYTHLIYQKGIQCTNCNKVTNVTGGKVVVVVKERKFLKVGK